MRLRFIWLVKPDNEMDAAMQGGAPYQTRLDPPPADERVAHDG